MAYETLLYIHCMLVPIFSRLGKHRPHTDCQLQSKLSTEIFSLSDNIIIIIRSIRNDNRLLCLGPVSSEGVIRKSLTKSWGCVTAGTGTWGPGGISCMERRYKGGCYCHHDHPAGDVFTTSGLLEGIVNVTRPWVQLLPFGNGNRF